MARYRFLTGSSTHGVHSTYRVVSLTAMCRNADTTRSRFHVSIWNRW
jgi:hypothetical protein